MKIYFMLGIMACSVIIGNAALTLTFPSNVTVNGNEVMLTDVAKIEGSDEEKKSLAPVSLGAAPIIGQSLDFSEPMIRMSLRQYYLDPDSMTIECSQPMHVSRNSTNIEGNALVAEAEKWLMERLTPAKGEELLLTPLHIPDGICLPEGKVSQHFDGDFSISGGTATALVSLDVEGKPCWSGTFIFTVKRMAMVLVAKKSLLCGQTVGMDAVALERRDISNVSAPLREVGQLAGRQLTQTVREGDILHEASLELIPLVRFNEPVRVQVYCGTLIISMTAVACEDGVKGKIIRVRTPQANEELNVRVTGAGMAEVVQ